MSLNKILRGIAPLAALAIAAAASGGCGKMHVSLDGEEGRKLSELDMSGDPPHSLALMGPDTVKIASGERLAITVDGDPELAKELRFTLKDGMLGIARRNGNWSNNDTATVNVTMPAPRKLMLAGSGRIVAPDLASESARVTMAGSGTIETDRVSTDQLKVDIAGSGTYLAAGRARTLKLAIAGSGDARLNALKVDDAKVDVAGSGATAFASDGTVRANIMGSGEVRVIGRATCKVTSVGSGRLVCENGATAEARATKDEDEG